MSSRKVLANLKKTIRTNVRTEKLQTDKLDITEEKIQNETGIMVLKRWGKILGLPGLGSYNTQTSAQALGNCHLFHPCASTQHTCEDGNSGVKY
jgi:hypothetical protein